MTPSNRLPLAFFLPLMQIMSIAPLLRLLCSFALISSASAFPSAPNKRDATPCSTKPGYIQLANGNYLDNAGSLTPNAIDGKVVFKPTNLLNRRGKFLLKGCYDAYAQNTTFQVVCTVRVTGCTSGVATLTMYALLPWQNCADPSFLGVMQHTTSDPRVSFGIEGDADTLNTLTFYRIPLNQSTDGIGDHRTAVWTSQSDGKTGLLLQPQWVQGYEDGCTCDTCLGRRAHQ